MMAFLMGLKSVSPAELNRLRQAGTVTVVDVNSRQSWLTARVPGALHVDPTSFLERELPSDKGRELVFYCSNPLCRKAPNAARRAKAMGFATVRVLSAGITGWVDAGLPTESGEAGERLSA